MTAPTLLITGVTGFLGAATLAQALQARPDLRLLAWVRAPSPAEARTRVRRSLARFEVAEAMADRVEVLCGDLADGAAMEDARLDAVTHVIHAAANTSFRSVREVRRVNILGALTLAHRMRRAPHLQRFVHVGTAFSCGLTDADAPIREDDYPRPDRRHLVEYTSAKAEAELLLENTAPELPLVIARPSVIVGHTRLGCGPSASIFWFYRVADLLRRLAWPMDTRDDVVPVDYAADALLALAFKPQLAHRRYHVSAGPAFASTWHDLAVAFARHHGARPDDPYLQIAPDELTAEQPRMAARLGPGDEARMLMALGLYYRFPPYLFDNARLLAEGVPAPPRFVDYLDVCMTRPSGRTVYQQMTDDD